MGQLNPLNSSQHRIRSPNISTSHEWTTDGFDDCACIEQWFQSIKSAADLEEVARWVLKYILSHCCCRSLPKTPKTQTALTVNNLAQKGLRVDHTSSNQTIFSYVPFLTSSNLYWPPNQGIGHRHCMQGQQDQKLPPVLSMSSPNKTTMLQPAPSFLHCPPLSHTNFVWLWTC
jgi:hypothetical protein